MQLVLHYLYAVSSPSPDVAASHSKAIFHNTLLKQIRRICNSYLRSEMSAGQSETISNVSFLLEMTNQSSLRGVAFNVAPFSPLVVSPYHPAYGSVSDWSSETQRSARHDETSSSI